MVRILLVEDNLIFRQTFKNYLLDRFPDILVDEAGDGIEALQNIDTHAPEIIFMDFRLPGDNGLVLSRAIKKSSPQVIILILTNYDLPEIREAVSQHGADYLMVKSKINHKLIEDMVQSRLDCPGILSGRAKTPAVKNKKLH